MFCFKYELYSDGSYIYLVTQQVHDGYFFPINIYLKFLEVYTLLLTFLSILKLFYIVFLFHISDQLTLFK